MRPTSIETISMSIWVDIQFFVIERSRGGFLSVVSNGSPGIEEQIRSQAERIADLELELAKAKKDSSTSSKPPSSDIVKPSAKKKPPGKRGKRKRGGQPGHKRQLRQPLLPERVDERIDYEINEKDVQRWGLTPTDQFETIQHIELPESPIHVTEHRLRVYLSPDGEAYLPDYPPPIHRRKSQQPARSKPPHQLTPLRLRLRLRLGLRTDVTRIRERLPGDVHGDCIRLPQISKRIVGYGSSRFVQYNGKGLYFLDAVFENDRFAGRWTLKVMPHVVFKEDLKVEVENLTGGMLIVKDRAFPITLRIPRMERSDLSQSRRRPHRTQ